VERRKHIRYDLRLPVLFGWNDSRHERIEDGCTENISSHGVYITCKADCCPPVGQRMTITLILPAAASATAGPTLKGEGMILRRETAGSELTCFAAETYFEITPSTSRLIS
jgi:hypothetical protein